MSSHFLVCPSDQDLIRQLGNRSLVPRLNRPDDISKVVDTINTYGAHLHCLLIETNVPLSTIVFKQEWQNLPIALYTSGMGRFPQFVKQLPVLRQLNIRIYLPIESAENYTSIRIISSLGIETAVVFQEEGMNWESLSDLVSYAYFARAPHAPIAPFDYLVTRYHRNQRTDFNSVYFDDPRTYLHLDSKGKVALTKAHLLSGKFIAQSIDELGDIDQNNDYINHLESWRDFFLKPDGCAYCSGWRVCLGKFSNFKNRNKACMKFFSDFMDSIELKQSLNNKGNKQIWQP